MTNFHTCVDIYREDGGAEHLTGHPDLPATTVEVALEHAADVRLNGLERTVVPVSTWHGDPVCLVHLQDLVRREAS
jgi:hypothetical protein